MPTNFWWNALYVALGFLVAMSFYSIFEAIVQWVRKPSKTEKKNKDSFHEYLISMWAQREKMRNSHAMPEPNHIPDPPMGYDLTYFDTMDEAGVVARRMRDIITLKGFASVSELYNLVGKSVTRYADTKRGWTDVSKAHVIWTEKGYIIDFKYPKDLD